MPFEQCSKNCTFLKGGHPLLCILTPELSGADQKKNHPVYLQLFDICSHDIFAAMLDKQPCYICNYAIFAVVLYSQAKKNFRHKFKRPPPFFWELLLLTFWRWSSSLSFFEEIFSWLKYVKWIKFFPPVWTLMKHSNWKTNSVAPTSLIIKWMSVYHLGRACEDFLTPND